MIFKIFILSIYFALTSIVHAQLKTYSFYDLDSLQKNEKRIVCVFIKTSWCTYCCKMENKILKESKIISILNSKYYFIKLNAEYKYPIIFNNKKYFYKPNGLNTGYHELAYLLADYNSKIIFPTLCFLNSENEIIYRYNQYTTSKQLYNILYNLIL